MPTDADTRTALVRDDRGMVCLKDGAVTYEVSWSPGKAAVYVEGGSLVPLALGQTREQLRAQLKTKSIGPNLIDELLRRLPDDWGKESEKAPSARPTDLPGYLAEALLRVAGLEWPGLPYHHLFGLQQRGLIERGSGGRGWKLTETGQIALRASAPATLALGESLKVAFSDTAPTPLPLVRALRLIAIGSWNSVPVADLARLAERRLIDPGKGTPFPPILTEAGIAQLGACAEEHEARRTAIEERLKRLRWLDAAAGEALFVRSAWEVVCKPPVPSAPETFYLSDLGEDPQVLAERAQQVLERRLDTEPTVAAFRTTEPTGAAHRGLFEILAEMGAAVTRGDGKLKIKLPNGWTFQAKEPWPSLMWMSRLIEWAKAYVPHKSWTLDVTQTEWDAVWSEFERRCRYNSDGDAPPEGIVIAGVPVVINVNDGQEERVFRPDAVARPELHPITKEKVFFPPTKPASRPEDMGRDALHTEVREHRAMLGQLQTPVAAATAAGPYAVKGAFSRAP